MSKGEITQDFAKLGEKNGVGSSPPIPYIWKDSNSACLVFPSHIQAKHSRGSLTLAFTGMKDGLLAPTNAVQCYGIHHQLVPNSPQPGSEDLKPEMGMAAWEQSNERAQRCLAHCKKEK